MDTLSPEDAWAMEEEKGFSPCGVLGVAVRDREGRPVVAIMSPLRDGRPFPTIYWLVRGPLHRKIAEIESSGLIKHLETSVIPKNPGVKGRLLKDTDRYKKKRRDLLERYGEGPCDRYREHLEAVGIGGLQDATRIKCLHMHYAHYLAEGNIIGEILERRFGLMRQFEVDIS